MTDEELFKIGDDERVRVVVNSNYKYEGYVVSIFEKRDGTLRCAVEDDEGGLLVHAPYQLEKPT